jgi:wobble nucleotide-excising tRNase
MTNKELEQKIEKLEKDARFNQEVLVRLTEGVDQLAKWVSVLTDKVQGLHDVLQLQTSRIDNCLARIIELEGYVTFNDDDEDSAAW